MVTNNATNTSITVGAGGEITYPLQPAFFATLSADVTDATGDGTQYNVLWNTEALDQGSDFNTSTGTFTAPVTGLYSFTSCITAAQIGALHTGGIWRFIATGFQYRCVNINPMVIANGGFISQTISGIFKMTAGDTMNTQIIISNSTKTVDIAWGSASSVQSWFSGYLVC
jgi:C1q domain-containing protein